MYKWYFLIYGNLNQSNSIQLIFIHIIYVTVNVSETKHFVEQHDLESSVCFGIVLVSILSPKACLSIVIIDSDVACCLLLLLKDSTLLQCGCSRAVDVVAVRSFWVVAIWLKHSMFIIAVATLYQ